MMTSLIVAQSGQLITGVVVVEITSFIDDLTFEAAKAVADAVMCARIAGTSQLIINFPPHDENNEDALQTLLDDLLSSLEMENEELGLKLTQSDPHNFIATITSAKN